MFAYILRRITLCYSYIDRGKPYYVYAFFYGQQS